MQTFNEEVSINLVGDWNNGGPSIGSESLVVEHSENGISPAITCLNDGGGHFVFRFVFGPDANLPNSEAASFWANWQGMVVTAQQLLSFVIGPRDASPPQMTVKAGATYVAGNFGVGVDPESRTQDVFEAPRFFNPAPAKMQILGNPGLNGTVEFQPNPGKGTNKSFVHSGDTGDWLIRSASDAGVVTIQDHNPNACVGIGTSTPTAKLEVIGDVRVSGDVFLTGGADCAEDFDIHGSSKVDAGSVMVMNDLGVLEEGREPYDTRVAGVISGAGEFKPAITLDKRSSPNIRQPIALLGKVYCKADAGFSPIKVGDLLTSSPTAGHAMKAVDPMRAFGAVIGKAMGPLAQGKGLIPILVTLR